MIPNLKLDEVDALLIDPHTHVRNALKVSLVDAGFSNLRDSGSVRNFLEAFQQHHVPDVIICDMDMEDNRPVEIMSAVRRGNWGRNPFSCVIGITWNPNNELVASQVNCGLDYLVRAPVAAGSVLKRISALIEHRRDFVVTTDYVGPDRREPERVDPVKDRLIRAPNSLRDKAVGEWDAKQFHKKIILASENVQACDIDRLAEGITVLANQVGQSNSDLPERRKKLCSIIEKLTGKMEKQAADAGLAHIVTLAQTCGRLATTLQQTAEEPDPRNIALLLQLAQAIRTALFSDDDAPKFATDIVRTVSAAG